MEKGFIKMPKELFEINISTEARVLYALILDRTSLSEENGWKDESGETFIYFTSKEIQKILSCSKNNVTKIMRELEDKKLIKRKRQGLSKPDMIYVYKESGIKNPKKQDSCFQNNENHDSHKMGTNNTKENNTYMSNTDINQSDPIGDGGWNEYEKRIKKNISYDNVVVQYGKGWVDEMVSIMLDTVMSPHEYIKINGISYPHEIVKSRFLKINDLHLGYIRDSLSRNKTKVRNIRAFLITTLFRAPETMENWYNARVNYDLNNTSAS